MTVQLILFDLDGTLLTSAGIGRASTKAALECIFGTSGNLDAFYPGGRTQEAIFVDTLLDAGISLSEYQAKRDQLYSFFTTEFKLKANNNRTRIKALPGAVELIQILTQREEYQLGIVTGNHQDNAAIKLQGAGFQPEWFPVGAYGNESAVRADLVLMALERAREIFDLAGGTVVVGDTTRDVASARDAGVISIALPTGTDDRKQLELSSPDFILDDLSDSESFLEILQKIGS